MKPEKGHWYRPDGTPQHWVSKKDGTGNRPTTLRDAKEQNLLPSCTSVLSILAKPALQEWLIRNAVHAVTTAPDILGESLDAKITRVLDTERQQDEESQRAMDRGTEIHDALEKLAKGEPIEPAIAPWVEPAWESFRGQKILHTEHVLVGPGYAGKADIISEVAGKVCITDYKSTRKLPKESWLEHQLQIAGYCRALFATVGGDPENILSANLYISTVDCGKYILCFNPHWMDAWTYGFAPLIQHWQWVKSYIPKQ